MTEQQGNLQYPAFQFSPLPRLVSVLSLVGLLRPQPPAHPAGPGENRPSGNASSSFSPEVHFPGACLGVLPWTTCVELGASVPSRRGLICKIKAATESGLQSPRLAQGGVSGPWGLSGSPSNPLLNNVQSLSLSAVGWVRDRGRLPA